MVNSESSISVSAQKLDESVSDDESEKKLSSVVDPDLNDIENGNEEVKSKSSKSSSIGQVDGTPEQ